MTNLQANNIIPETNFVVWGLTSNMLNVQVDYYISLIVKYFTKYFWVIPSDHKLRSSCIPPGFSQLIPCLKCLKSVTFSLSVSSSALISFNAILFSLFQCFFHHFYSHSSLINFAQFVLRALDYSLQKPVALSTLFLSNNFCLIQNDCLCVVILYIIHKFCGSKN